MISLGGEAHRLLRLLMQVPQPLIGPAPPIRVIPQSSGEVRILVWSPVEIDGEMLTSWSESAGTLLELVDGRLLLRGPNDGHVETYHVNAGRAQEVRSPFSAVSEPRPAGGDSVTYAAIVKALVDWDGPYPPTQGAILGALGITTERGLRAALQRDSERSGEKRSWAAAIAFARKLRGSARRHEEQDRN
jgi:hypothetical protein